MEYTHNETDFSFVKCVDKSKAQLKCDIIAK